MSDVLLGERRDDVVDRLSSDYANGLIELDELERRLELVHSAQTPVELDAVVTSTELVQAQRVRIVMASIERTGPWVVPQQLAARVLFGNLVLDLREARFAATGTTIDVHVTMGNVEVIVPPGVEVDVRASAFLGNIEERTERVATAGAPVIRIVGRVKLGNLELSTLRRGELIKA